MTPTERTLRYLRNDCNLYCGVIERWIKGANIRQDYMGFGDILAFNSHQTVMVQSCGNSYSEHHKKILANLNAPLWLANPNHSLWLISWRKVKKKRGGKQMVYKPRIKKYTQADFNV